MLEDSSTETSYASDEEENKFPVVRVTCEAIIFLVLVGIAVFLFLGRGEEEVAMVTPPVAEEPSAVAGGSLLDEEMVVPTLSLESMYYAGGPDLSARLIGERDGVEIHYYTAEDPTGEDSSKGFTALEDKHNLFDCRNEITISAVATAHGDCNTFKNSRYWGYEYSGNELANQAAGKTGLELFDGRFWLSQGELDVTGDQYGYLNTEKMTLVGGKRYYLMSSIDLRVSCMDSDTDRLSDGREDMNSNGTLDAGETDRNDADTEDDGLTDWTEICDSDPENPVDPNNPDSDGDGLQDGTEAGVAIPMPDTSAPPFVPDEDPDTVTHPGKADTDGGGVPDGEEDANKNGKVDEGETDPNDPGDDGDTVECPEDVDTINLTGRLVDQITEEAVGDAELLSAYEYTPESVVSGVDGSFSFSVNTDFKRTEGVEQGQCDTIGSWSFKRSCYDYSAVSMRYEEEGNIVLRKHVFDQGPIETIDITGQEDVVELEEIKAYPMADIRVTSDVPVSFNVHYHYKNLEGTNGVGSSGFSTERMMSTALPLDYDVHLILTDEQENEFQTPVFHTPLNAMCSAVRLDYSDGVATWSFCGNGLIEGGEACDDGNTGAGDGCDGECTMEDGWVCTGEPSECTPLIPDLPEE